MPRSDAVYGFLAATLVAAPCHAWGPHTEITRAAQAVVPDAAAIKKELGDEWDRLAKDYVWMGDWRESVRPDHYADDYLLFPNAPEHFSHMPPDVRRTFEPFFRRALLAIRTENPQNAARWVGSLLHFAQDAGSPPHAANVVGETHAKMERWVDETKIDIGNYHPRLFGKLDNEAMEAFLERMDGLHEFSKVRGIKLKPLVENLKERVNQPLELGCALECARVSADLLHTLYTLGCQKLAKQGGTICGKIEFQSPAGYAKAPGKVMLIGTDYSTTTDAEGRFVFRNLPVGKYDAWLSATGYEADRVADIVVSAGKDVRIDRNLRVDRVPSNLVRNSSFLVEWVRPKQPDGWYRDPVKRGRWASALIRVPVGKRCSVQVDFQNGKSCPVSVRWRTDPSKADEPEVKLEGAIGVVAPDALLKPFEKGFLFLDVLIETEKPLPEICRHVAVTFAD